MHRNEKSDLEFYTIHPHYDVYAHEKNFGLIFVPGLISAAAV